MITISNLFCMFVCMNYSIFVIFSLFIYSKTYAFIPLETKIKIIEFSSKILPRVDTIGHK